MPWNLSSNCTVWLMLSLIAPPSLITHSLTLLYIPGNYRFLGHLYAAESLIKLCRVADAITHLAPENITDLGMLPPGVTNFSEQTGWYFLT